MSRIREMTHVGEITDGDSLLLYSSRNDETRRTSISLLLDKIATKFGVAENSLRNTQPITVTAAPYNNAPAIPITSGRNIHLLLKPSQGINSATVTLPESSIRQDGQEIVITATNAINNLVLAGNGATVANSNYTLTANGYMKIRFVYSEQTWYRIG